MSKAIQEGQIEMTKSMSIWPITIILLVIMTMIQTNCKDGDPYTASFISNTN